MQSCPKLVANIRFIRAKVAEYHRQKMSAQAESEARERVALATLAVERDGVAAMRGVVKVDLLRRARTAALDMFAECLRQCRNHTSV